MTIRLHGEPPYLDALVDFIRRKGPDPILVVVDTILDLAHVSEMVRARFRGEPVGILSGLTETDKAPSQLEEFRTGKIRILIATSARALTGLFPSGITRLHVAHPRPTKSQITIDQMRSMVQISCTVLNGKSELPGSRRAV
jgi:hypothetical protein